MAHQLYELQQMQMLPLQSKINMTVSRIQEWYSYWTSKGEGVYYSWSGGKDSTVLRHIIKTELPYLDIKGVFVDTGLGYADTRKANGSYYRFNLLWHCLCAEVYSGSYAGRH